MAYRSREECVLPRRHCPKAGRPPVPCRHTARLMPPCHMLTPHTSDYVACRHGGVRNTTLKMVDTRRCPEPYLLFHQTYANDRDTIPVFHIRITSPISALIAEAATPSAKPTFQKCSPLFRLRCHHAIAAASPLLSFTMFIFRFAHAAFRVSYLSPLYQTPPPAFIFTPEYMLDSCPRRRRPHALKHASNG